MRAKTRQIVFASVAVLVVTLMIFGMAWLAGPDPVSDDLEKTAGQERRELAETSLSGGAAKLDAYEWVNKGEGLVRIPIERAMRLVVHNSGSLRALHEGKNVRTLAASVARGPHTDWDGYLGGDKRNQYSPLTQINKDNVHKLEMAWHFRTGEPTDRTQIQCNPLVVDGVLYGTTQKLNCFALDAASGELGWKFSPRPKGRLSGNQNRGVAVWRDGDELRLFYTAGEHIYALDAYTGRLIDSFGDGGIASLKSGLGERAQNLWVVSTSPGVVFEDLLIMGTRVSEGGNAAPGYIRAYDVRTGEVRWVFHTIPKPGEYGHDTWPVDAHEYAGGANAWAGLSLDSERGIVFVPTGSASADFYGADRLGANLFANCVLALDARTGDRIWHFQTVHHDLWDRDLPAPPNLITVTRDGRQVDAVAQVTKSGFVFLFDRENGEPLFEIEERLVPPSDIPGESAWPTQPFPVKPPPFARQHFTAADINTVVPGAHEYISGNMAGHRTGEPFIPPSLEGTLLYPGCDGGGEWGGSAFDAESGILYVNSSEMVYILKLIPTGSEVGATMGSPGAEAYRLYCAMCHGENKEGNVTADFPALTDVGKRLSREELGDIIRNGKNMMPGMPHINAGTQTALIDHLFGTEAVSTGKVPGLETSPANGKGPAYRFGGYDRLLTPGGYPAMNPPWGTLNAIDMSKGEILWQVTLGEFPELVEQGIPPTGTESYGGPVATAGGLVFIAGTKDELIRAFDKDTGEELWRHPLPACGFATPSVYEVDGKQYVVIACGGGKRKSKSGDSYVAFALP